VDFLLFLNGGRWVSVDDKASGTLVGKFDHTLAPSSPIGASADKPTTDFD
jgi:hypothetical protein